jgi:dUTP pyrophosphatase
MIIKVKKLDPNAKIPTKAYKGDLGIDFYALDTFHGLPNEVLRVRTGIALELPEGYGLIIKDRSSVGLNGIFTCAGVIDNGYRGEIIIGMWSNEPFTIKKWTKVAQGILVPQFEVDFEEVEELSEAERGEKGFGSSNKK